MKAFAWRLTLAILILGGMAAVRPALAADEASALRDLNQSLSPQLKRNPFQRPMVLVSVEMPSLLKGDVYAELNYPFATVNSMLNDPAQGPANWCDMLMLHLNTKYCHAIKTTTTAGNVTLLSMNIGKKVEQDLATTDHMVFRYTNVASQSDYFKVDLDADIGPMNTRNYDISLEAVAIKGNRTFVHLSYAYSYGMLGRVAMKSYLATIGSGKVGFTLVDNGTAAQAKYIGGVRGMIERNAMRYYLAIDACLGALSGSPDARLEQRLTKWFNATEQYPRQLYEIEWADYLAMKRSEYRRQQTLQ